MVGELFAVGNAVAQAGSNVTAGAAVRRSSPIGVLLIATPVTVAIALMIAIVGAAPLERTPLVWGLLAGGVGGIGLAFSYRAFALGRVAVIVPVTTCAATMVQVAAGWLIEGRPPLGTIVGAAVCLAAVVVMSRQAGEPGAGPDPRRAVLFALVAGVCFAAFVVLLAQGADQSGAWALAAARVGVLVVVLAVAALMRARPPLTMRTAGLAGAAGVLDVVANLLLLVALAAASLALVAAIVAVAPVVAALMAIAFLGERLQRRQVAGLGLALAGVWIVVLA